MNLQELAQQIHQADRGDKCGPEDVERLIQAWLETQIESYGSIECDYSGTPPFADTEWGNDPAPRCLWCAGTGHPFGDKSYRICECQWKIPNFY